MITCEADVLRIERVVAESATRAREGRLVTAIKHLEKTEPSRLNSLEKYVHGSIYEPSTADNERLTLARAILATPVNRAAHNLAVAAGYLAVSPAWLAIGTITDDADRAVYKSSLPAPSSGVPAHV